MLMHEENSSDMLQEDPAVITDPPAEQENAAPQWSAPAAEAEDPQTPAAEQEETAEESPYISYESPVYQWQAVTESTRKKGHRGVRRFVGFVAVIVAIIGFQMPADLALVSATQGAAFGAFPIVYIICMAVWFYEVTVVSGRSEDLRKFFDQVGGGDIRIQAMMIAFWMREPRAFSTSCGSPPWGPSAVTSKPSCCCRWGCFSSCWRDSSSPGSPTDCCWPWRWRFWTSSLWWGRGR